MIGTREREWVGKSTVARAGFGVGVARKHVGVDAIELVERP